MFWKRSIEVLAVLFFMSSVAVPVVLSADFAAELPSSLESTVTTFKDSVVNLIAENKTIAETNDGLRLKVRAIRDQIRTLKNEESRLRAQLSTVDTHYQKRRGSIDGLQKSLADDVQVLGSIQNEQLMIEADLKSKQGVADDFQNQVETLQKEILGLTSDADPAAGLGSRAEALQAERVSLERELAEITKRARLLKNEWQSLGVAINSGSEQAGVFEKEHAQLKQDLDNKEHVLEGVRQQTLDLKRILEQLSDGASAASLLAQRQSELDALELELQTLQTSIGAVEDKVSLLDKGEVRENLQRKKKEELLKDLSARNMALRTELSRTQQDMVKLDKQKSLLEKTLYQPKY